MKGRTRAYLKKLNLLELVKTQKVLRSNPTVESDLNPFDNSVITLYTYNKDQNVIHKNIDAEAIKTYIKPENTNWVNTDIIRKSTIETITNLFHIHPLITEDILNKHQRPKIDEFDNQVYIVMHMLYFNEDTHSIESEQVNFIVGENYLLTFQEDSIRDLFNPIREKIEYKLHLLPSHKVDYLLYLLIDIIVDNYFRVMEQMGEKIENLEEEITFNYNHNYSMSSISNLRKDMILLRRVILPVREILSAIHKSENEIFTEKTLQYFKDIYDNVLHAIDLSENYRDMINNNRDLYMNQVNLRTNEAMKFLAILTSLMAPATVVGGIFGMNFDKIPYLHNDYGFWIAVGIMLFVPVLMMWYFRKKGWY